MNPEFTDTDYAWAAGFLDGEGCFTIVKHSSRQTDPSQRSLVISAVQVRRDPLDRLQSMFGGKVRRLGITKRGNEIWQWGLGNYPDVRRTIELLLPYLMVKKREAEIVYEFAQTIRRRGRMRSDGANATTPEEVAIRMPLIAELKEIRERSYAPKTQAVFA